MYNLAIIQARMGASRLPGKVMMELAGHPVLWHVFQRVKRSRYIDEIVVVTTFKKKDLEIIKYCSSEGIRVFAGSEDDVPDRYYQAAKLFKPDNVIRITADCPMHDPSVIDQVVGTHVKEDNDYTSNTMEETFPDGLDCEAVKFPVLKDAWEKAVMASEREHVTQYIIKNSSYKKGSVTSLVDKGAERWTLDTEEDYKFIKNVFRKLYPANPWFGADDVYSLLDAEPGLKDINSGITRNEGLLKSVKNDHVVVLEGD